MDALQPGLSATVREIVGEDQTAESIGSGDVPVLATPAVLTFVERAAVAAVALRLGSGSTSVGSRVELDHVAPTPVGGRIEASATLEAVEDRRLTFSFQVSDGQRVVARGKHVRIVVDRDEFLTAERPRG